MRYNYITAGHGGPMSHVDYYNNKPKKYKRLKNGVYIILNKISRDYGYVYEVVVPENNPFFNAAAFRYCVRKPSHFDGEQLNKVLYKALIE